MAVPTTSFRSNVPLPRGYVIDPTTGELVKGATTNVPTTPGSTNYPVLNERPAWETGVPGNGVPTGQASTGVGPDGAPFYIDQYGDQWKLIDNQWIKAQQTPTGLTVFTNGPATEMHKRLTSEGTTFGNYLDYAIRSEAERNERPVLPPGHPQSQQLASTMRSQAAAGNLINQQAQEAADEARLFGNQNAWWQSALQGGVMEVDRAQREQLTRQQGYDDDAIRQLNDLYAQQQSNASGANQRANDLYGTYVTQQSALNAQDQSNLSRYMSETDPYMRQLSGISFDPEGLAAQRQGLSMAQGAASGSLDYRAAQAGFNRAALYEAPSAAQAQGTWANAERYRSNPGDVQRQNDAWLDLYNVGDGSLDYRADQWSTPEWARQQQQNAIGQIDRDIQYGMIEQQKVLDAINQDISRGGDGQRAAIAAIERELAGGAGTMSAQQKQALERLRTEIDSGGVDLRNAISQYKELTSPQVTAQERYVADIARRSFEAQDRGNREAQSRDFAWRGMRTPGGELAALSAARQQTGLDRTQAELGLQANAIGRSMQALEGYTNASAMHRAQQLQGEGMYADATAQARAQQQQALAMLSDAENALRAAQQQGLALSAQQTNAIRAAHQNAIAMYNDATARMREQEDAVGMFNTNARNTAYANNQATRFAGKTSAAQQSNAIRQANDQVGMFNTNQRNTVDMFNAGQANNLSMFNAGETNRVNMFNTDQANTNSMFNAGQQNQIGMFNAGQQNQASANNQATRLGGINSSISAANSLRSANDAVNMFNASYAQNEASRISALAGQRAGMGLSTTGQIGARNSDIFSSGIGVNDASYRRNQDTIGMGVSNTGTQHTIRTNTNNFAGSIPQNTFNNMQGAYGSFLGGAGMSNSISQQNRLAQQQMQGLGILAQNNPKYRLGA